jgi:hypothetical protein
MSVCACVCVCVLCSGIGSFFAVSLLVAGGAAAAAVVLAPKFKDVKLAGLWR